MILLPPQAHDGFDTVDLIQHDLPDGATEVKLACAGTAIGTVTVPADATDDDAWRLVEGAIAVGLPKYRQARTRRLRLLHGAG